MLSVTYRFLFFIFLCTPALTTHAQKLTRYIDPFIGTGGHGHTFPGACVPFGMVQLSPDNGSQGWDWCSGYNFIDTTIAGFSHMHLSGTGCGDWTDISVMPGTRHVDDSTKYNRVGFSHANEHAEAGFYHVLLNNGIDVNLTATERCGLHQYTFPKGSPRFLRFQLTYMINYDSATSTSIYRLNDSTVVGYRISRGWAKTQRVYFAARLSQPIAGMHIYDNNTHKEVSPLAAKKEGRYNAELEFANFSAKPLMMKVALSSVSTDKALAALKEIPTWNFNKVQKDAEAKWETEMAKLEVKTKDERLKRIFYTALYHTCIHPNIYSDADGAYQTEAGQKLKTKTGQRYNVFSLWDTFRGLHPLFTITQPARLADMMNSMLDFCDETGLLPVWELSSAENNCMSGYHAVPVLADAVLKNTPGVDAARALEAMKKSANQNIRGTQWYRRYGYVPQDSAWHTVTKTLEYAYDDWCIAQVALKLGRIDDYNHYMKMSAAYKRLFDAETGFIRAKNSDGSWVQPFDPYFTSTDGSKSFYEEGNAWQYTFFVPHDIRGLAKGFGSNEKFAEKLDAMFSAPSQLNGEQAPPDISGLIGQYVHGNEPSHHIAYMYSYIGQPWKTQQWVRTIIDSMYHDQPEGYAGNEDCGQMSAWAVLSMTGFYPANPSGAEYVFGSPVFDELNIKLPSGKTMKITAANTSKNNPYIQSIKLNGQPYTKVFISHSDLLKGGTLEFVMGAQPNKSFGVAEKDWPSSVY
jgi:predicted alpha-1,2-mannosidase